MPMYDAKINPKPTHCLDETQPQRHSLRTIDGVNTDYSFDNIFAPCLNLRVPASQKRLAATGLKGTALVAMPIYCA